MHRKPRKKVVRIEIRSNIGPSRHLFPQCATAILECGHRVDCGVSVEYALKRKRMACDECDK